MNPRIFPLSVIALLTLANFACAQQTAPFLIESPNRSVRIEISLKKVGNETDVPCWRVFYKNHPILLDSRLGATFEDGSTVGGPSAIESTKVRPHHAQYTVAVGKHSHIVDSCMEGIVSLRDRASSKQWTVEFRAYDDGAAFHYLFPSQASWKDLALSSEQTEFSLPSGAVAYCLPLNSFTTSFEGRYQKKQVNQIPDNWLIGLPTSIECPGAGWVGITEANLTDYAGMYLAANSKHPGSLISRLSPLPDNPKIAVRAALPHDSPWRVLLLGDTPGSLLDSDIVFNLSEPCALSDTSWIHPGKTTFPWWNDYYLENVPFKPGLNTATMKYYIDFCAAAHIPYHSLDGYKNIGWYGCQIGPHTPADITKAVPEIDLPEVLAYAKSKGVKLRLWLHWEDVRGKMDRVFPLYHQWGIEGVMLDFMNRDDQEMVNFLREVVEKAAANHLTVTFHGVFKPTGLERTYPNLLTSESVLNLEYDKWDPLGCSPEHQLTVVFTRMLAGPMDFHQGSFRGVPVEQFKPRNTAPLVMGSPGFMLATYVVFENHLPMVADYPSAYRNHPALPMLARIPANWDETRCLTGAVGDYIVMARRKGDDWYVGAMNAGNARTRDVPLRLLGKGKYRAQIESDDPNWKTNHRTVESVQQVSAGDTLKLNLDSAGGAVVRLSPEK